MIRTALQRCAYSPSLSEQGIGLFLFWGGSRFHFANPTKGKDEPASISFLQETWSLTGSWFGPFSFERNPLVSAMFADWRITFLDSWHLRGVPGRSVRDAGGGICARRCRPPGTNMWLFAGARNPDLICKFRGCGGRGEREGGEGGGGGRERGKGMPKRNLK